MSVSNRNGIWIVDYRPDGRMGKRVRVKLPEAVQSIEEAKDIEKLLKISSHKEKNKESAQYKENFRTIGDLFEEYLDWFRIHRSERTYEDVKSVFRNHINRLMGNELAEHINESHILIYKKLRKKDVLLQPNPPKDEAKRRKLGGVSNRTITKELSYLSAFFTWCVDHGHLLARKFKIEKLKFKRPVPIILSIEEVMRILDTAEPFYRVFFLTLYSLGLRLNEARMLKWSDVDFNTGAVRVKQKGGSYKLLPLNPALEQGLKSLGTEKYEYVFTSKRTGRPIINITKALQRAAKKAGIAKHVNPHLFRHSFATHLVGKGVNLRVIQRFLGHSQIGTTEFYTHIAMDQLKDASNILQIGMQEKGEK